MSPISMSSSKRNQGSLLPKDRIVKKISLDKLIPAPKSWRFLFPLSPDKMLELRRSILEIGLISPIIVWEQKDGSYMILSGYNRTEAYKQILDEHGLEEGFDKDGFTSIPAISYDFSEISEDKAKEVFINMKK